MMDYRQRVIEEAAQLFRTYGIKTVTMDMLATHMSISKRTIYEVFKDKDELLRGVISSMTIKQKELMEKILRESENVIEAIFKMLDLMSAHFRNMSPAFLLDMKKFHNKILSKIDEANELPYYRDNSEILLRGIKEGLFREDIDIKITNKCLVEVTRLANDKDASSPDSMMNEDMIRNIYINYLRGISTLKGLELITFYENR
ncbi:MAG: TetR/AcrR family transcriptional regulator [Bacteroidales bacterium]